MFTERSLKMLPTLTSDSYDDYLMSDYNIMPTMMCQENDYNIMTLQTQRLTGLELTHNSTPYKFDDNNQGFSLSGRKIGVVFSFLC